MTQSRFDPSCNYEPAWCPGCGNFDIRKILQAAFEELGLKNNEIVISSGIGQAAKMPQYLEVNYFNGLHGRSLPVATAIKSVNPELTVIAESGDGCTYGEGGNHFIHTVRRNPDITNLVHDNMIYGLTKGQGSPTTMKGTITSVQLNGSYLEPFNPLATALVNGATFVARIFSGNFEHSKEIIKSAIKHEGYSLVDILHPCVSFNKTNTFMWYKKHTYFLENHDVTDKLAAIKLSEDRENPALGIFYNVKTEVFRKRNGIYTDKNNKPLIKRAFNPEKISDLLKSFA